MYTQCPECLTVYEIDEDALQASLGIVHCGRCGERFDALRTLSDALPDAPLTPLPAQDPEWHAPTLTEAVPPSAYEQAARRLRSRHGPAATEQHELDLDAPGSVPPADAADLPRTNSADDWFADMESQLAARPAGATAGPSIPEVDAAKPWGIESVDETDSDSTSADPADAGAIDTDLALPLETTDDIDAALVPGVMGSTDATAEEPDAPRIESPWLPDGDMTGAEDEAVPAPAEDPGETGAADPVAAGESASAAELPEAATTPAPVYIRPHRRHVSLAGVAWGIGCVVLLLALAVQLAWADRVELVRDPATRAWAERVCRNIPCRLPPIKDTAQLQLLSRDVRPDPNTPGALTITATVRNAAAFRQPWPVVVVELTDFDNRPVAMRRFRPAEYMPDPARRAAGIAPGATAALAFEVADPGKDAGGFRFGFE